MSQVRWNVSAGKHTEGKGWEFNQDFRTRAAARARAERIHNDRPELTATIRRMELMTDFIPGFVTWYETHQEQWPQEVA